jgi:hypothetical protein
MNAEFFALAFVAAWHRVVRAVPAGVESREDTYLLDRQLRGLSVRVRRGGALEVKAYRGSPGRAQHQDPGMDLGPGRRADPLWPGDAGPDSLGCRMNQAHARAGARGAR